MAYTGTFLAINGLTISVDRESFDRNYNDVQNFMRSEGNTIEGTLFEQKREFQFTIPIVKTDYEYQAQRDWIKGRGAYWNFERVDGVTTRFNRFGTDGGFGLTTTSITNNNVSTVSCKFGTYSMQVASAGSTVVTVSWGPETQYSISLWRYSNFGGLNTWNLHTQTWDGATLAHFAGVTGTTLTSGFTNWFSASATTRALTLTLAGKDAAAGNTTAWYDSLMIVPYCMTTNQMAARQARVIDIPPLPYVEADGDFLEDLAPLTVKGFVGSSHVEQVQSAGATLNARVVKLTLTER